MEINQVKLKAMFADPRKLYQNLSQRKGYKPKQVVEFDAELLAPGWTSMEYVLLVVMIHSTQEARLIMLPSDDCTALRESLEHLQIALNSSQLLRRRETPFGLGL